MEVSELCGPASVAMMLQYTDTPSSLADILQKMQQGDAFIPGTGTILGRVPASVDRRIRFIGYAPAFLVAWLLRNGFVGAASITRPEGSHIIFINHCDEKGNFHYYDANTSANPHVMSYETWKEVSNKRIIVVRCDDHPGLPTDGNCY